MNHLPRLVLSPRPALSLIIVTCYDNCMAGIPRRPGRPPTGRAMSSAQRMQRYRARLRAAGLRPALHWRPMVQAPLTPGLLKHRIIEARSLALHCLIAQKIARKPALLEVARRNVTAWRSRYGGDPPRALDEW